MHRQFIYSYSIEAVSTSFKKSCYVSLAECLIEAQAGFRKSFSTVDPILAFNGIISHILNTKKQLYSVFVDFRRTFDSVNRKCLWYKMTKCGIRGNRFNVIKSIYATVKSKVLNPDGTTSEAFDCIIGVRQGEFISLFICLIHQ